MRFDDLVRIVFRNLNRVRVRTLLTTLGVIIGVAAIVTLLSVALGFQESITGQLEGIGDVNQITVMRPRFGPGMVRGGGGVAQSERKLLDDEAIEEIETIEGVQTVIPSLSVNGTIEIGRYQATSNLTGIDPGKISTLGIVMKDGRLLRKNDRDAIIVGFSVNDTFREKKTKKLVENMDILGKKAEIVLTRLDDEGNEETKSFNVRIVGVIEEKGTESDYEIYIPLELAVEIREWTEDQPNILKEEGYDRLIVRAADSSMVEDLTTKIEELGYQAFSFKEMVTSMNQVFTILEIVLLGIGAIALIVAALGIINTMLMSILERTREIGIMKVVGASNADVTRIFLMEALGIGLLGGIGGVGLGFVVSQVIDVIAGMYMGQEGTSQSLVSMPLWLIGFAIGFAMLVGLISGVYPAKKAAELSPVEALQHQ